MPAPVSAALPGPLRAAAPARGIGVSASAPPSASIPPPSRRRAMPLPAVRGVLSEVRPYPCVSPVIRNSFPRLTSGHRATPVCRSLRESNFRNLAEQ